MAIFGRLKHKVCGASLEVIEWTDETSDNIIWCYPHSGTAIKIGAQLIVRDTQIAVLMDEGLCADVFYSGNFDLTTRNMPILTALKGWKYDFNSSFSADIYFVNTKQFLNLRWQTQNPLTMYDCDFGAVSISASGSYAFHIMDNPIAFINKIVCKIENFTSENILDRIYTILVTDFAEYADNSKISALDLAANYNEYSDEFFIALKSNLEGLGVELTSFLIEDVVVPSKLNDKLNQRILRENKKHTPLPEREQSMNLLAHNNKDLDKTDMILSDTFEFIDIIPPPIPKHPMFYVAINNEQKGPFSVKKIEEMIRFGEITPDTPVWTIGMFDWVVAGRVKILTYLFNMKPPPLKNE